MEASRLPTGSKERVTFIRKRAKDYLVTQLAGQITLSQFYRLLTIIEAEAGLYFSRHDWSGGKAALREPQKASSPPLPPPLPPEPVKSEALRQALAKIGLPVKGRRKVTPETLCDFLQINGRDLADRLTPLRPDMNVLYMSGYTENAIVHHGVLETGIFFIPKPFRIKTLLGKIREILGESLRQP
jgi:hypothetical protein